MTQQFPQKFRSSESHYEGGTTKTVGWVERSETQHSCY